MCLILPRLGCIHSSSRMQASLERPDASILLPDVSVIGGDIYLLPDVVAPFPPSPYLSPLPIYDSFMTLRPFAARAKPFFINNLRHSEPMRFLHSGIDFMPVVQMQKGRK